MVAAIAAQLRQRWLVIQLFKGTSAGIVDVLVTLQL